MPQTKSGSLVYQWPFFFTNFDIWMGPFSAICNKLAQMSTNDVKNVNRKQNFLGKFVRFGSIFDWNLGDIYVLNGSLLEKIQYMGRTFKCSAANPYPNQIWVPSQDLSYLPWSYTQLEYICSFLFSCLLLSAQKCNVNISTLTANIWEGYHSSWFLYHSYTPT